ncbi:MAG: O-antigen/teichoic acid export membrane protein [Candidatus Latescibacterota bacterium]|jgi:O-antigen/teichoic acid export membrane protein
MPRGRLTRKIGIVALGRAANTLAIYAVYALAARTWDKEVCGFFQAVWVLSNTLVPIFILGLPTAVLYFFPRRNNRRELALQAGLCLLLSGLLLSGILYWGGGALFGFLEGNPVETAPFARYIIAFIPYVFALVAGGCIDSLLVAGEREHWQAWLGLAAASGLVAVSALGLTWGLSLQNVLGLFSIVGLLRLLVGYGLVRRMLGGGIWSDFGDLSALITYAKPIAFNDAVGAVSRSVDKYVVLYFFGASIFAEYQFGAVEVPISLLLAAVVTVLVPEVSQLYQEGKVEEIAALWHRAISRLALVALPLFFFLLFFSDSFIAWYLPAGYNDSTWVFRIFLLALPLRCAVYNPLLVGMGKAQWALWGSVGDLILNVLLSLLLVDILARIWPHWAFLGPAIATVVSTYAQVFFLVGAIAWHLHWSWRRLLPWGALGRLGLYSLLVAGGTRWLVGSLETAFYQLLLGGLVFVLGLGALLWSSRSQRQDLRALATAFVKKGG